MTDDRHTFGSSPVADMATTTRRGFLAGSTALAAVAISGSATRAAAAATSVVATIH
jgi:hypothetical protein